jgi:hypothetical protein
MEQATRLDVVKTKLGWPNVKIIKPIVKAKQISIKRKGCAIQKPLEPPVKKNIFIRRM